MAGTTAARGRIDKRQAILDVAFTVFARRGYDKACVQEIADEAGVAKPTVYNHLNDKQTLFEHAALAAADAVAAQTLAIVDELREPGDDLAAALTDAAHRLLEVCASDRARALRALTYAQLGAFPDLVDTVLTRTSRTVAESLADRLARLALAGRLRVTDPSEAAEQLLALLTAPLEARSRLGTRPVPAEELDSIAAAAIRTFLAAYGSR
ncbi:TetR/AcrR family transcriptional regulator [Nocardia amamiensis]|uniref:TetR/AcrR family transcriptional regulator n=1 Tax=Nocardia amamiensis TaxID=404578 RepID=A0ABS0CQ25_9NOCA|nr:TetR/AcrR family transcriptional regulator [Nocardia amamiensis]MBF6298671.1 TetR/AcrR family transcriptional regulator [Nocardia amamiensis]